MLIGFKIQGRNGLLMRFREERGYNQKQAAKLAGVSASEWSAVETMKFIKVGTPALKRIADLIDARVDEVCPDEMRRVCLTLRRTMYGEIDANRLAARNTTDRLCLPSPADVVEFKLDAQDIRERVRKALDEREAYFKERYRKKEWESALKELDDRKANVHVRKEELKDPDSMPRYVYNGLAETEVFRMAHGEFGDGTSYTIQEIGNKLKLSSLHVRRYLDGMEKEWLPGTLGMDMDTLMAQLRIGEYLEADELSDD